MRAPLSGDGLRVLEAQLGRMRAMIYRYYELFFRFTGGGLVAVGDASASSSAINTSNAYIGTGSVIRTDGNFTPRELRGWAEWIKAHQKRRTLYVYFNNDWQGFAIRNAMALRRLLGDITSSPVSDAAV